MADVESSFRTLALQHPDVATAFGNRFFWNRVPDLSKLPVDAKFPYIKASTPADAIAKHFKGNSVGKTIIQLDVFDETKEDVNANAILLRNWLDGYSGQMGEYSVRIFVTNFPSAFDSEQRLFQRMIELEVGYA